MSVFPITSALSTSFVRRVFLVNFSIVSFERKHCEKRAPTEFKSQNKTRRLIKNNTYYAWTLSCWAHWCSSNLVAPRSVTEVSRSFTCTGRRVPAPSDTHTRVGLGRADMDHKQSWVYRQCWGHINRQDRRSNMNEINMIEFSWWWHDIHVIWVRSPLSPSI